MTLTTEQQEREVLTKMVQVLKEENEQAKQKLEKLEKGAHVVEQQHQERNEVGKATNETKESHPSTVQAVDPVDPAIRVLLEEINMLMTKLLELADFEVENMPAKISGLYNHIQSDVAMLYGGSLNDCSPDLQNQLRYYENELQWAVTTVSYILGSGATYIEHADEFEHFLKSNSKAQIYVFSFRWGSMGTGSPLWDLFNDTLLKYMQSAGPNEPTKCVLLDSDALGIQEAECIKKYLDSTCICEDVLADMNQYRDLCTAQAADYEVMELPQKKTHFEAPCPLSMKGKEDERCPGEAVEWRCSKCLYPLEYGFDDHLHCSCGASKVANFNFRCSAPCHGSKHAYYDPKAIPGIVNNLKSFNGKTILILGETGVGKSTFINGFANYLQFETLKEAINVEELSSPVKSSFVLTNDDFEEIKVTTGSEDNECHLVGQSATQGTKAHRFKYKGSDVRLIDTPGIGDTRGIEQDKENFQSILSHISYYEEIHGICILLKPNNSRLTVLFEFCVKELLAHLHKSAAKNIVFCFTNARSTNYRPGDTLPALKMLLEANENVPIALKHETVYCMDNESFRYLACLKHGGIKFKKTEDEIYQLSWDQAREETNRLMRHVSGLEAHIVKDTISINDVRRKLVDLTKPMAEIAKHIDTIIRNLEDQKREIENSEQSASEILKTINIQVPTLERNVLQYPRTVCTSLSCCDIHKINGQDVKNFNVHCHEQCYLEGVQADTINNPDIKQCKAMIASGGQTCSECCCEWNVHMHVTYELLSVMKEGEDLAAKQRYAGYTDCIKLKEKVAADYEAKISELEHEKKVVIRASAQFGIFLKENSVIPYNDAMMAYFNYMLKQEREKGDQSGDYSMLDKLQLMKQSYEYECQIIKDATGIMAATEEGSISTAAQDQQEVLEELFRLNNFGPNLKTILSQLDRDKSYKAEFVESNHAIETVGVLRRLVNTVGNVFNFSIFNRKGKGASTKGKNDLKKNWQQQQHSKHNSGGGKMQQQLNGQGRANHSTNFGPVNGSHFQNSSTGYVPFGSHNNAPYPFPPPPLLRHHPPNFRQGDLSSDWNNRNDRFHK